MSVENFNELKDLVDLNESSLVGFTLFFLKENNENELIPMKLEMDSEDKEIENSIFNLRNEFENKNLMSYLQETDLSSQESIGFVNEEYLEQFTRLKKLIFTEKDFYVLSKPEDLNNVKGLLVRLKLKKINDSEAKDVLLYSQITRKNFYKSKPLWSIKFGKEAVLKRVKEPMINLNLNYCCIHYEDEIFVLHAHFFEQLFKIDIRFKIATEEVLKDLEAMDLISNFPEFELSCRGNKNFQRKLFHIKHSGGLKDLSFNNFCEVNNKVDGILKIKFNKNQTISIDPENMHQSVDQIIRIINNEAAETIISGETVFAGRKQTIE